MKKLFMAFLAVATIAMVGCKKDDPTPTPTPTPGGGDDPVEEMPDVAAPAAGKTTVVLRLPQGTPGIVYAVGTVNSWAEADYETCPFEKIEGYDNRWVKQTFDWDASMEMKVLAVPTKPELAGWTYQWAKNIDEADPDPSITEDHVIILKGGDALENFVYENQGQPKLKGLADQGVIYIDVKAWADNPVIPNIPATYLEIKHNWQSGEAWTWRVMEAKGNGVFEYKSRWGNTGCNLRDKSEGDGAWFDLPKLTVEDGIALNDSVLFKVTSIAAAADCQIEVKLIEKGVVTKKDINISAVVPAGWEHCYIYSWNGEGNQTGDWPGEELTITAGKVEKAFTQVAIPLNFIFNDGNGTQTTDQSTEDNVADFDIESNIKIN